jgi:hypothetical protein
MLDLTILAVMAASVRPMAKPGSTRCRHVPYPEIGNHLNLYAKKYNNNNPNQNVGSDIPSIAPVMQE